MKAVRLAQVGLLALGLGLAPALQAATVVFTSSTSWQVPAGVTSITLRAWGGGGSGATRNGNGAGGGGGGAFAGNTVSVTAGSTLTIVVGSGGAAISSSATSGQAGTASSVSLGGSTMVSALGGAGGSNTGSGGAGGSKSSSFGSTKGGGGTGGEGQQGGGSTKGGGGGGGSGTSTGGDGSAGGQGANALGGNGGTGGASGGRGGGNNGAAQNGATPGGGGGGAEDGTTPSGAGGAGRVEIDYTGGSSGPDHIRIEHSGWSGLTCTPSTFTVRACANSSCSSAYTTGISVALSSSNAAFLWPSGSTVTIAAGSSTATVNGQLPQVGSTVLGVGSSNPAATNALQCRSNGTPYGSCSYSAAAAGFLLAVPHHRSGSSSSLTISAVRQSDNSLACTPAFGNVSRAISYSCGYDNPASGTLPVRLSGQGVNASGSSSAACGSRSISTSFDANGQASLPLIYADAGRMNLTASYSGSAGSGDTGLSMTGSTSFVAAPSDFAVTSSVTPYVAGIAFSASVTARNSSGAPTPNFGREGETVSLSFARTSPTGAGAVNGSFSHGSLGFTNGVATPSSLVWSEVGSGTLAAALSDSDYLGSGLAVNGSLSGVGPFLPHHFLINVTPACGSFTHAGQAFNVTATARNGLSTPGTTLNYDGSSATSPTHARQLNWGEVTALGLGTLSPSSWPAGQFSGGVATGTLSYSFTSKQTAPQSLLLRATDADGRSSSAQPSLEPAVALRSSRLLLQNAVGSASRALNLPLRLEYWSGTSWVLNSADTCTAALLANGAVAQSGRVNALGNSTSAWSTPVQSISLSNGVGQLRLAPPSPSGSGALDVALNLGSASSDRACLPATRPTTTGANLAWLRSRQGSANGCGNREDSDPSARASFGSIAGESAKRVHERQVD